jgi:hypothetical protein
LASTEVAELLRTVSRAVRDGAYRPHPPRLVRIPKLTGGSRTLTIRSLGDRVMAAALHEALTPLWESVFLPQSMAWRPGRGVWWLPLATMPRELEESKSAIVERHEFGSERKEA